MALDLNRIEAFARELLEAEARRRSIRNPEFRTRAELIRLILKHQYGGGFGLGRESVMRGLRNVEIARDVLLSTLAATPLSSFVQRVTGKREPEAPQANVSVAHADVSPRRDTLKPPVRIAQPEPATRTFIEPEPIRTLSMARLLAAQDHRERALAIYEELLAQDSENADLRREAEAVRRGEKAPAPVLPTPTATRSIASVPGSPDRLRCEGEPQRGLSLHWRVSDDGLRRARAVLGDHGELVVRLINIRTDPERVVCSEITEHGPVAVEDTWTAPALPESSRCLAAVGLRHGQRFVAIAHAHPSRAAIHEVSAA